MKKILSLGVAAAVVSMTAVAASAAIEPVILDEAIAGETITVEVVATGVASETMQFAIKASDNLTYVAGSAQTGTIGLLDWNEDKMQVGGMNIGGFKDGTVVTLTYTVAADAAADEEVSVALVPVDDATASDINADAYVVNVIDTTPEVPDEPTEPEVPEEPEEPTEPELPEEPTEPETPDEPVDPELPEEPTEPETPDEPTEPETPDEPTEPENPDTGVALAVVPAVLAGAAIVVAKKRK